MRYYLAIDQGTTGTTVVLYNQDFHLCAKTNIEFKQYYPMPTYVEHDLNEIWATTIKAIEKTLAESKVHPKDVFSIGITNQRETTCAFDIKGIPLAKAIVWQDKRTTTFCHQLKSKQFGNITAHEIIHKKTGLPVDPYFSASKMNWLINNCENVQRAQNDKTLRLGTIDTYLLYKLTNGESFKTDTSNASRTMLMDLHTLNWDNDLLKIFSINKGELPTICETFSLFGKTKNLSILPDGVPIYCLIGDQQSALLGQLAVNKNDSKCTYGTGAFMLTNTGEDLVYSSSGLITTVAFTYNKKTSYALEGSSYIAGAAVQWLRDNLKIIKTSAEVEQLAREITNLNEMGNIIFFPFFSGIGSPFWKESALASIIGLTRDTNSSHIARATLEGIALSVCDLFDVMEKDSKQKIKVLNVDGGASQNNLLMEIQASFLERDIMRPYNIETTSLGAAIGSAIGIGELSIEKINDLKDRGNFFSGSKSNNDETRKYYLAKKDLWKKTISKIYF